MLFLLTLKDRAPIRTLIDRGRGAYLAPPVFTLTIAEDRRIMEIAIFGG